MKKFGLVGRSLSHSFSPSYFQNKFRDLGISATYELFELEEISELKNLLKTPDLAGLNVSIPYKTQVIPFLDQLSPEAERAGAVNTIVFKKGKTIGFNTDIFGFEQSLQMHLKKKPETALIFGDGGAAQAVKVALENRGIRYKVVSRKGNLNFNQISKDLLHKAKLWINTTPVGTWPNTEDVLPLDFSTLTKEHLVIDLIYNPPMTRLLKEANERRAITVNGLYMLEQQAEKSWMLWTE